MLFDLNFQAFGYSPKYTYEAARDKGKMLEVGKHMRVYYAEHYSKDRVA